MQATPDVSHDDHSKSVLLDQLWWRGDLIREGTHSGKVPVIAQELDSMFRHVFIIIVSVPFC